MKAHKSAEFIAGGGLKEPDNYSLLEPEGWCGLVKINAGGIDPNQRA